MSSRVSDIGKVIERAIRRRAAIIERDDINAYRLLSGPFQGLPGVFIDIYGDAAVLIVYEGEADPALDVASLAAVIRDRLMLGAVYLKHFPRDRSKLGGRFEQMLTDPEPLVGDSIPEALTILEYGKHFEVRLYDGFSTGLFLDQRENRRALAAWCAERNQPRVLNTFAYTGAFSVCCAAAGAVVTSVDISRRYLDWGKRNFALNDLNSGPHYFTRADVFEFLTMAQRKKLRFDLVILDPPSFSAGSKGASFSAQRDYPRLLREASKVTTPGGSIFCSTNNTALAQGDHFDRAIREGLGAQCRQLSLPDPPPDFAMEKGRLACRWFVRD